MPLKGMTAAENLQLMEVLWDDLSRNPDDIPAPAWHEEVLAERERLIEQGQAKFLPLDEFRQSIKKEMKI